MAKVNTSQYHAVAIAAANKFGIDPQLFVRQIQQESGFNPNARSGAGAVGIAQIMPATAKGWGVDPTDPIASLNAAAKAMAGYTKTYLKQGHDLATAQGYALAAYNGGPGAAQYFQKHGGVFHNPKAPRNAWANQTGEYVQKIMGGGVNTPGKKSSPQVATQYEMPNVAAPQSPLAGMKMVDVGGRMIPNVDPLKMGLQPQASPLDTQSGMPQVQSSLPALMASIQRDRNKPVETNFLGDVANAAINQGSFNIANRPHGNGVGSAIGTGLGGLANAVTGVGLLAMTPIAPEISVPIGLGLAGAAGGASAEARSQLNQTGRIDNPLAVGVQGATGGLLNLIPGSQAAKFVPRAAANALRFGAGGAAADVIAQGVRGQQFNPMETLNAAMMGGGMGVGAAAFHPAAQVAPEQSSLQPKLDAVQAMRDQAPFIVNQRMSPEIAANKAAALNAMDIQTEGLLNKLGAEGQRMSPDPVQSVPNPAANMTMSPNKQFGFKLNAPPAKAPAQMLAALDQQMEMQLNGLRAPSALVQEQPGPGQFTNAQMSRGASNGVAQFDTRSGDAGNSNPTRPADQTFARPTAARRYVNELTLKGYAPEEIVTTTQGKQTTVTVAPQVHPPEVQAQLEAARAKYQDRVDAIKRSTPTWGEGAHKAYDYQQQQANLKAAGMRHAAERRQIIQGDSMELVEGGLTPKELAAVQQRASSMYEGKPVLVNGKEGTVVRNAFGKTKVQLADGEVLSVTRDQIEPVLPAERALAGLGDSAPASTAKPAAAMDATHDIGVARLAADAHPNRSISLEQFQQQHPGTFESMSPDEQAVLKATFGAIAEDHALDLNYGTKTGSTSKVDYKRLTPAYVHHGDNSIQIVGLNGNGDWIKPTLSKRLADNTFGSPLASEGYGFRAAPSKSTEAPVFSQRDAALRPQKTADDVLRQQASAFTRLAEKFPQNPSIQMMAKDFENGIDVQTIQKNLKRAMTLPKEEAEAFMQEVNKRC